MATRNLRWQLMGVVLTVFFLAGCVTPTTQVGDPERGRELFETSAGLNPRFGCKGCHSLKGYVFQGPSLQGISERAGDRVPELSAAEYLRQSIVDPGAYVVEGFEKEMPAFSELSEEDLNDLVAFLLTQ
jgi:mono/diheme cytochrome c family protein